MAVAVWLQPSPPLGLGSAEGRSQPPLVILQGLTASREERSATCTALQRSTSLKPQSLPLPRECRDGSKSAAPCSALCLRLRHLQAGLHGGGSALPASGISGPSGSSQKSQGFGASTVQIQLKSVGRTQASVSSVFP